MLEIPLKNIVIQVIFFRPKMKYFSSWTLVITMLCSVKAPPLPFIGFCEDLENYGDVKEGTLLPCDAIGVHQEKGVSKCKEYINEPYCQILPVIKTCGPNLWEIPAEFFVGKKSIVHTSKSGPVDLKMECVMNPCPENHGPWLHRNPENGKYNCLKIFPADGIGDCSRGVVDKNQRNELYCKKFDADLETLLSETPWMVFLALALFIVAFILGVGAGIRCMWIQRTRVKERVQQVSNNLSLYKMLDLHI